MSVTVAPSYPVYRQPLGLPAGSIRAALSLLIVGLFLLLLALPSDKQVVIPLYLYFLLCMVLVFFAAHGHSIAPEGVAHPSPWWLPRGTLRLLITLAIIGVVAWQFYVDPEKVIDRVTPHPGQLAQWPYLMMSLVGGFLLGWLIRRGPWRDAYWFQDLRAWIALIAMLILCGEILVRAFINPNIAEGHNVPFMERLLVAIVAFYFGVRCS
jgi:hypothetical protein